MATMIPIACAVCGSYPEATRIAYGSATALLTFLPLILIGGGVWYLWRRASQIDRLELGGAKQTIGGENQT